MGPITRREEESRRRFIPAITGNGRREATGKHENYSRLTAWSKRALPPLTRAAYTYLCVDWHRAVPSSKPNAYLTTSGNGNAIAFRESEPPVAPVARGKFSNKDFSIERNLLNDFQLLNVTEALLAFNDAQRV